MLTDKVD